MFNILKNSNPEDPKKPESAAETVDTVPVDWEPVSDHPDVVSSSPRNRAVETESALPAPFPSLAIPSEASVPLPPSEAQPESTPAETTGTKSTPAAREAAQLLYPPLPQKQKRKHVLEYMFSSETRSGRFIRTLLRWLAATTGLFALGLLAGYLILYQPTQNQLEAAQSKLKQANQTVSQKDQSVQSAVAETTQMQQSLQQVRADLTKATSENDVLMVLVSVSNARVAVVNKDGATAKAAIEQAQVDLTKAQVFIEGIDKTKFDVLKTRLDLAAKELLGDPQAAQTDLDKLAVDLTDLRQKLFKK